MTREELSKLQDNLLQELQRRESLGGYGADAEIIKFLTASLWMVVAHLAKKERTAVRLNSLLKKKK